MDVLIFPNIGTPLCYSRSLVRSYRGPLLWKKWLGLLMDTGASDAWPHGIPHLVNSQRTKGVRHSKAWHCSRQEATQCLSNSPHCSSAGRIGVKEGLANSTAS